MWCHWPICQEFCHNCSPNVEKRSHSFSITIWISVQTVFTAHTHMHSASLLTVVIDSTRRDPAVAGTKAGHSEHCSPSLNSTPAAPWGEGKNAGYLGKGFEISCIRTEEARGSPKDYTEHFARTHPAHINTWLYLTQKYITTCISPLGSQEDLYVRVTAVKVGGRFLVERESEQASFKPSVQAGIECSLPLKLIVDSMLHLEPLWIAEFRMK